MSGSMNRSEIDIGAGGGVDVHDEECLSLDTIQGRPLPEVPERYSALSVGLKATCHVYNQADEFFVQDKDGYLRPRPTQLPPRSIRRVKDMASERTYVNEIHSPSNKENQGMEVGYVEEDAAVGACESGEVGGRGGCQLEDVIEDQYIKMH